MNVVKELDFVYIVNGTRFVTEEEAINYARTLQDEEEQKEKSRQDDEEKNEER